MKTKEELVSVIESIKGLDIALTIDDSNAVIHYLKQPTLNPMKIDEERFKAIHSRNDIAGWMSALREYNSTLENHQVLQPFPKDKPDWFEWSLDTSKYDLWDELVKTYGTPTKKELVSVEELEKEIYDSTVNLNDNECKVLAKSLVNKYGLNPPKRDEFPFNLKKGDKFMGGGREFILEKLETTPRLYTRTGYFEVTDCTPYIEPSIHDKVKEKLGIELYQEFMKEVKG